MNNVLYQNGKFLEEMLAGFNPDPVNKILRGVMTLTHLQAFEEPLTIALSICDIQ